MQTTKKDLIKTIDFQKEWYELTPDQQANFLSLYKIKLLNAANKAKVIYLYNQTRMIVDERGVDKLDLYI